MMASHAHQTKALKWLLIQQYQAMETKISIFIWFHGSLIDIIGNKRVVAN